MAPIPQLSSVGRYRDLTLLGAGGMGAVYRAYDPSLDRTVALKLVLVQPGHSGHNPDYLIRFEREAKAIARLSHPHIVQVYDFGRDEADNPYFVMELVKGKALSTVSKERGPLPPAEALELIRQAAIGLQAAHDVGIVHRDVKPHNMLVDERGQVKLVDFGVARVAGGVSEGMTATNEALGTLHYMAPEVLSGKSVDARADVYAMGAILYECLAGRPPHVGATSEATLLAIAEGRAADLGALGGRASSRVAKLIGRALAPRPEDRFASADAMAEALRRAREPATDESAPRSSDGERMRAVFVPALVAMALGAAITFAILALR